MTKKLNRKLVNGVLLIVSAIVCLCGIGGINFWRYAFSDEPMVVAAMECDYAKVKLYLDRGASPNARFDSMQSALEAAQDCKDKRISDLLKERGATE